MACNMSPKEYDTVEITERVCGGVGFKGPKKRPSKAHVQRVCIISVSFVYAS